MIDKNYLCIWAKNININQIIDWLKIILIEKVNYKIIIFFDENKLNTELKEIINNYNLILIDSININNYFDSWLYLAKMDLDNNAMLLCINSNYIFNFNEFFQLYKNNFVFDKLENYEILSIVRPIKSILIQAKLANLIEYNLLSNHNSYANKNIICGSVYYWRIMLGIINFFILFQKYNHNYDKEFLATNLFACCYPDLVKLI